MPVIHSQQAATDEWLHGQLNEQAFVAGTRSMQQTRQPVAEAEHGARLMRIGTVAGDDAIAAPEGVEL